MSVIRTQADSPAAPAVVGGMTADQMETARRVAERLQGEFGVLLRSFPLERRTIVAMSDWLGVTRPVCQRLLRGVRHRDDPINALLYLPGVRGLHQFLTAVGAHGGKQVLLDAAAAAVDEYAALIDVHGGSHARLCKAIREAMAATEGPVPVITSAGPPDDGLEARRLGFESARYATNREYATHLAVFIYRPDANDNTLMDCVTAMGMVGIRRQPGALPICPMQTHAHDDSEEAGETTYEIGLPSFVHAMTSFCSDPMPRIVQRETSTGRPVLIDPDHACADPLDLVLQSEFCGAPNPMHHEPTLEECHLVSDGPSHDLIIVGYLHRGLARASITTMSAFAPGNRGPVGPPVAGPDGILHSNQSAHRWFDRLPRRPRLEHIGPGLEQAALPAYPRLGELVRELFAIKAWDPDEFVGYRCHEAFPMWGAQYMMTFDFGGEEGA